MDINPPQPRAPQPTPAPAQAALVGKPGFWKSLTKNEKIIAVLAVILFLAVFSITLDANKYRAQVRIVEGQGKVGINPTTERLDFGDLSRGTSAIRRIDMKNSGSVPMKIFILKLGSITDMMKANASVFTLRPGEEKKIEFSLYVPASAETGKTYSGRIFIFRIPF